MSARRILVTSALPYANGHIHLGHLVEYLQTDIWVRYQKLRGNRCIYVCADDTHGTAIMNRARLENRSEEALIAEMRDAHLEDFTGFGVQFDNYGSTHSDENRELCAKFWSKMRAADLIVERDVSQFYDPVKETFLADRFIKGTCPKCGAKDQYGDNCENCLTNYSPTELIEPRSTLSGAVPELRNSPHSFVILEKLHAWLAEWVETSGALQSEIANYLKGFFLKEPLKDWDVSRPARYFGFEIPDRPGHYWYVWFDAPIGYIASTWQWCKSQGEKLDDWWQNDQAEIHHFIGKDITYFHTLFWPGMLHATGHTLPKKVHIHGFLTVDGEKMSKSRGTFIMARTYLKHLDPAYLRYFYAAKLSSRVEDLDMNLEEFKSKCDSDLVNKVVNLASRTARFIHETGLSAIYPEDGGLFAAGVAAGDEIATAYEECEYSKAMRAIMQLADAANVYVDSKEPWRLKKDPARAGELQDICSVTLNLFRQIVIYLAPVLPKLREQTAVLLNSPIHHWDDARTPLLGTPVAAFQPLLQRVDPAKVQLMIDDSKDTLGKTPDAVSPVSPAASGAHSTLETLKKTAHDVATVAGKVLGDVVRETTDIVGKLTGQVTETSWNDGPEPLAAEPLAETCTIDDFAKVDLRVARIVKAEEVPEARKLLKLTISLGGDQVRTVFAGIKAAYKPEELVGRLVVVVANLQPRQMKFGLSEGMVAAAGAGGAEVFLLSPDTGAKPGHRVH